jgi:hypothetical protein
MLAWRTIHARLDLTWLDNLLLLVLHMKSLASNTPLLLPYNCGIQEESIVLEQVTRLHSALAESTSSESRTCLPGDFLSMLGVGSRPEIIFSTTQ